jgi:hypothetical protein
MKSSRGSKKHSFDSNAITASRETQGRAPDPEVVSNASDSPNTLIHLRTDSTFGRILRNRFSARYRAAILMTAASLPTSPASLPTSPASLPTSPASLPTSPASLPTSPASLPTSPACLLTSPACLLTSPACLLTSPACLLMSPTSLLTSPASLLTSPASLLTSPASLPTVQAAMPMTWADAPKTRVKVSSDFSHAELVEGLRVTCAKDRRAARISFSLPEVFPGKHI